MLILHKSNRDIFFQPVVVESMDMEEDEEVLALAAGGGGKVRVCEIMAMEI